jgi:hypothetical protein
MQIRHRLVSITGLTIVGVIFLPAYGEPPPDTEMLAPFPHPKGYVCYRASSPIVIDGKLSDPAWEAAAWTDSFVDIEGDKKSKPRYRTRVKMLWDDEALYVAAELEEPHVWATLTAHDSIIFNDNDFEMFLSPTGDNHLYAELELNALNTTWDLLLTKPYKDKGVALQAWEIVGLKTAVHIDGTLNDSRDKDTGWTVEIKWPWAGLKELAELTLPPKNGDQWRINFSRVEWDTEIDDGKYRKLPKRPEHNWVWSPQGVIDMHRPERWGYIQFSTAKPGKELFRPDPDWAIRDLLHRAYYAERAYFKANGKYATTLRELGLKDTEKLSLEATRSCFEISVALPDEKGAKPRRMVIAQDSRIWTE